MNEIRRVGFHGVQGKIFKDVEDLANVHPAGAGRDWRECRCVPCCCWMKPANGWSCAPSTGPGARRGWHEFHAFREATHAGAPAVEAHELEGGDRQLRHHELAKDAKEHGVAIGFLSNFLAKQRALEVRENTGVCHVNFLGE